MKISLTKKQREMLINQPETGMGYQVANLKMKDGTVIENINIINSDHFEIDYEINIYDIEYISVVTEDHR